MPRRHCLWVYRPERLLFLEGSKSSASWQVNSVSWLVTVPPGFSSNGALAPGVLRTIWVSYLWANVPSPDHRYLYLGRIPMGSQAAWAAKETSNIRVEACPSSGPSTHKMLKRSRVLVQLHGKGGMGGSLCLPRVLVLNINDSATYSLFHLDSVPPSLLFPTCKMGRKIFIGCLWGRNVSFKNWPNLKTKIFIK